MENKDEESAGTAENNGAKENNNIDDEYDKMREQLGSGLALLNELRSALDEQVSLFNGKTLNELYANQSDLDAVKTTASRAKRFLRATGKFMVDDVTTSMASLRDSLSNYSKAIHDKLLAERQTATAEDSVQPDSVEGKGHAQAGRAHEAFVRLAVELKELEQYAAEVEESVNRAATSGEEVSKLVDQAENELENASSEATRGESDEDKRAREEEEQRQKEETERRQREAEEERQRREEEEQRLKEEREARRLEEEERLKKEDPRHWPAIIYELPAAEDQLGSNVACVVRAPPESVSLRKEQLECKGVMWRETRYKVGENEEVVSNVVCLRPSSGTDLQFESAVWVAIPFAGSQRGRETVIRFQKVSNPTSDTEKADDEKQQEGGTAGTNGGSATAAGEHPVADSREWTDMLTRDTTVEGQETCRFVETAIRQLDASGVNIIVLTRPKRDVDRWNNRGGRLVSSIDQRVSIGAPKNCFRLSTEVTLQLIPVDSSAMAALKERYDGCEQLLGTSPIVVLGFSNKPQKPVVVSVTNPSGGSKKPKASDTNGRKGAGGQMSGATAGAGATTLPKAKPTGGAGSGDVDDVIQLLVKDSGGKWRHRDNVKLEFQRDCVVFQLNETIQRLVLLRTTASVESADLIRIVGRLEESLAERTVQLVVRQLADDPTTVFIECCRRDNVERLLNGKLRQNEFTEGPEPSKLFCLREGDLIELSFRDNIAPVAAEGATSTDSATSRRQYLFNSNLSSINTQLIVREVSSFAQNALDSYRGYVRLSLVERPYQPPPKLPGPRPAGMTQQTATTGGQGGSTGAKKPAPAAAGKPAQVAIDQYLVSEVILSLPKPPKEPAQIKRIEMPIKPTGPLSSEYFDQLADALGDEWVRLAEALRLGRPAIQRITQAHANERNSDSIRLSSRDALIQWYRSTQKSNNKVEDLRLALVEAGRNDLAEELNAKNKEFRYEIDKKHQGERLKKAIKVFTESVAAVRAWREVGKELGLTAEELEAIGGPAPADGGRRVGGPGSKSSASGPLNPEWRNHAEKMLNKWIERNENEVGTEELVASLKKLKLNDTAANILVIA